MFKPILIFLQNGLGQKRKGIDKTVNELFTHYEKKELFLESYKYLISDSNDLTTNLKLMYDVNFNQNNKNIIISIGGDHSMSIGTVSSTLNKFGSNTKVIWIDAHADINTKKSSITGNVHGMPLSFLTGLDKSNDYDFISELLKFDNLCYIGIRDLDIEEIEVIKKHNIKNILTNEFNSNITDVIEHLIDWCGTNPIHLSIDVDSLDPSYMQFTGTRVPEGLELNNLLYFIEKICSKTNIVNVDLAELNLYNPDCNGLDEKYKNNSFENFNLIFEKLYINLIK